MKRILLTGMSGTGKSTVIEELQSRGFVAIDTDYDDWCQEVTDPLTGETEWVWDEERIRELLIRPLSGPLFVSGCRTNQGQFYPYFDFKVLFSAPLEVMLERVASRATNDYGKQEDERAEIVANFEMVQPLLKKSADVELDSSVMSVEEIVEFLSNLVAD